MILCTPHWQYDMIGGGMASSDYINHYTDGWTEGMGIGHEILKSDLLGIRVLQYTHPSTHTFVYTCVFTHTPAHIHIHMCIYR